MNSIITIGQLQAQVAAWSKKNFPNNKPHHPLLGLSEEVGELSHAHLKNEQSIRGTAAEHYAAKVDAVADILIYLCDYCERNDIDLETSVSTTWAKVKERDWRNNPQNGSEVK